MRRWLIGGLVVGLVNGGLAIVLAWWLGRRPSTFGWYSYTPMPRRYADYLPAAATRPGWETALLIVAAFSVANAAAAALWFAIQRRRAAA